MHFSEHKHISIETVLEQVNKHLKSAQKSNIRLPIMIWGYEATAIKIQDAIANLSTAKETAWLSSAPKENNIFGKKANYIIGKEFFSGNCELISDTDINLLTAFAGTIRGGGIWTFRVTSELDNALDYFNKHLLNELKNSPGLHINCLEDSFILRPQLENKMFSELSVEDFSQQQLAIQAIIDTAKGRSHRPLVISAPRGRGKSAALGIASAKIGQEENKNIIITAPSYNSATVVFNHYNANTDSKCLKFMAIDELAHSLPAADLLIIDEAASFPTPVLKKLTQQYKRIVFATTTYGYEGSGQGFKLRFHPHLDTNFPNWKEVKLDNPIRWSNSDLLEPLINHLFFLDTESSTINDFDELNEHVEYKKIDKDTLLNNQPLQADIIGLLRIAHYKTRPSDIKQLFNNEEQILFAAFYKNNLLAITLCINEGPIEETLAKAIFQGKRRPPGNIIPQSLLFNLGYTKAWSLKSLRIMRIAVHPMFQRNGIGSQLLKNVETYASDNGYDIIGSTFGAIPELVKFWKRLEHQPLRLGQSEKASSGMHSVFFAKPLEKLLSCDFSDLECSFLKTLKTQLPSGLKALDPDILRNLVSGTPSNYPSAKEWNTTYSYAFLNRSLEDCISSLETCLLYAMSKKEGKQKFALNFNLLTAAVLQRQKISKTVNDFSLSGKKQLDRELKSNVAKLIICYANRETKSNILSFTFNLS